MPFDFPEPSGGAILWAMPEELSLDVAGLRVAARAWGPPDGPGWLALHGWLDNGRSFDHLAPLLAGQRIIALDLPGHGLSDWRHADADYSFPSWVPAVFEAADALGWQRFSILGHSMGAAIGVLAAGTLPDRVERLIAIEASGPFSIPEGSAADLLAVAVADRYKQPRLTVHPTQLAAAQRLSSAVPGLSEGGASLLVERGLREVPGGFSWRADPRLRHHPAVLYTEEQVHAFLRRIRATTLFVFADQGWEFPPGSVEARIQSVPNAQLAKLRGRHHLHLDEAPAVAQVVNAFIEGKSGAALRPGVTRRMY
jgi:pimeloyl-ACP methyl ester carboxylesterase